MGHSNTKHGSEMIRYTSQYAASATLQRSLDNFVRCSGGNGLLALDFDATTVQIHTYGRWTGSADALAAHVRPVLRAILNLAVSRPDIHVGIVTFSGQVALIKDVLSLILGSKELADKVYIRGGRETWFVPPGTSREGKQSHIASILHEISTKQGLTSMAPQNHVLLIDDDTNNIAIALQGGHRALAFPLMPLPGIHMKSKVEAEGVNVVYRIQLRHGALLCVSSGSVVSFSGHAKGAIVNAANTAGLGGGGVDGAISTAGGATLLAARRALPEQDGVRIPTGSCRMTGPGKFGRLQVPYVIHAVGPIYGSSDSCEVEDKLLYSAYSSSMECANQNGIELLAFSLISAGIFRGSRSLEHVLTIAVRAIAENVYPGLREVHLVGFSDAEIDAIVVIVRASEELSLLSAEERIKASAEAGNSVVSVGPDGDDQILSFLEQLEKLCAAEL